MKKFIATLLSLFFILLPQPSNAARPAVDLYDIKKLYIKVKPKIKKSTVVANPVEPIKKIQQEIIETPVSINNIIIDKVKKNARLFFIDENYKTVSNINYIIDEKINDKNKELIFKLVNKTMFAFKDIYKDQNVTLFFWTQENIDWANKIHNDLYGGNIPSHAQRLFNCNSASANEFNGKRFIIMCIPNDFENSLGSGASIPHELAHIVQYQQKYFMYSNMPCWIIEGSASFYGEFIGLSSADSKQLREHFAKQSFDFYNNKIKISTREMMSKNPSDLFRLLEDRTCGFFNNQNYVEAGYLVGSIFFEILVGIYGNEKVIEFYKTFDVSSDWKNNFKNTFLISVDDFYLKVTPHLENMI